MFGYTKIRFSKRMRFVSLLGLVVCVPGPRAVAQAPGRVTATCDGSQLTLTLSWDSVSGKQYQLLSTADLGSPWRQVATQAKPLVATSNRLSYTLSLGLETQFYRVAELAASAPTGMVWIWPGTFLMGSPTNEVGRQSDEGPQHAVSIRQGFWMARFEVTQTEYLGLMGDNPSQHTGEPTCPVESVSWEMATNYCARLTESERAGGRLPPGFVYRLPTEAEWEYACRAGTTTAYSFGNDEFALEEYCWGGHGSDLGHPHPVGQKHPNPWGLYDMHGNVFEFCLDWYEAYPDGLIEHGTNTCHTMRGGSFYCPAWVIRSACRNHVLLPNQVSTLTGFRVVLAPGQP